MRRAATRHSGRVSVAAMGTTAPLQSRASRPTSSHASPALVSSMAAPRRSFSTTPVAHSSSSGGSGEETSGDTAEGHSSVHTKTVGDSKTRLVVVLFTSTDIRVKDNYALALAAAKAKKEQCPLACLYCYDERTFAQPSLVAGFYRTGPQRVAALNECVASLRHQLRSYGGELYVRVGRPEDVVPVFTRALLTAEAIGAGDAASLPAAKALSSSSSFAAPPQVEGEDLELDDDDATAGVTAAADVARYEAELCALSQVGTSTDLLRAVAAEKTAAGEISPALARALQRSVSESVLDLDGVSVFASTQYAPHEAWVQHQMKAALTSGTMSALRAESDAGTAPIDRDDGESTTVRDGTLYSSLTLDGKGQARLQYTRSDGSFAGGVSSSDSSGQTGGTAGSAGGAVLNTVWQSTLIHIDDLSTPPAAMSHMLRPFWDEYQLLTPRPVPPYDCTDGRLRRGIRWASMDPAAVRDRMSTATGPAGEPVPMRTVSDTTAASSASTQTKSGSEKSADGVADQIVHAVPPTPMYEYVPEPESDPTALAAVTYKTRPKRRQEANTAGDRCCGALPTLASLGYDARQGFLGRDGARFKNYKYCHGGEAGAIEHLQQWMETGGLRDYVALGRDKSTRVQQHGVNASIISGAIAHGAMSPRVYYEMLREYSYDMMGKGTTENAVLEGFYRMAQRDFWHFSGLRWGHTLFAEYGPRPEDTDDIPEYRIDPHIIHKWCHGQTGVPFADAAMLELTNSGWCNHPGRQALTWQLTRGYGQDWRVAAEWFERTCIDYDPFVCYGNTAYFSELIKDRFGEPVRSLSYISAKQDSTGIYTKRWLPLLERVPEAFIHRPHVMTLEMQQMHQVVLGESYPYPIKLWAGATKELPAGALKAMRAGDMAAIKKLEPGWGEAGKCSTAVLPKTEAMPAVPAAFVEKQQQIVGKAEAIANRYAIAEHARRRATPQPTLAQQEEVQQIAH